MFYRENGEGGFAHQTLRHTAAAAGLVGKLHKDRDRQEETGHGDLYCVTGQSFKSARRDGGVSKCPCDN